MNYLDFFSDVPKFYILKKESNKTKFGSLLFLIYIVLIILIAVYYIIDYIKNDKYIIESLSITNYFNLNQIEELNKKEKMNPEYELEIQIEIDEDYHKLKIVDNNNKQIDLSESHLKPISIKGNITDLRFFIKYECENDYCENEKDEYHINKQYKMKLYYDHYNYDFQSENVLKNTFNIRKSYIFNYNNYTRISNNWVNVFFKERKGLWKEEHIDTYGYFYKNFDEIKGNEIHKDYDTGKWYKILFQFEIKNEHKEEIEYKRRRLSIITVFANILSYFSNLFFTFKLINKYYSKNFDNFKIIENIFKKKIKNDITFNINEENENEKIKLNNQNEKKLNLLTENLSNNKINDNENENDKEENKIIYDDLLNKNFKKLSFIDFYINNIYSKCCKKYNHQEIINICNNIMFKYCSIESILYNQILLENLFKDYHWNNKELNSIINNEYIIQLQNLL